MKQLTYLLSGLLLSFIVLLSPLDISAKEVEENIKNDLSTSETDSEFVEEDHNKSNLVVVEDGEDITDLDDLEHAEDVDHFDEAENDLDLESTELEVADKTTVEDKDSQNTSVSVNEGESDENKSVDESMSTTTDSIALTSPMNEQLTFKKGDRHENIAAIKVKLNKIGFSGITVTSYFGDYMERRVRDFQSYYGLSITGRIDSATLKKLDDTYNSPFQLNQRHEDIKEIKKMLNHLDYSGITVTSLYGSYMERKVTEFQADYNLIVNGIVDEVTLQTLKDQASKETFKKGDTHPQLARIKAKLNRIGFSGILETNYFGDYMERRVKDFQIYYQLPVNGRLDGRTVSKIKDIDDSPYQLGQQHEYIKVIKKKLNSIGFGGITVTSYYGDYTKRQVEAFQSAQELVVNGIVDDVTLNRLKEIYLTPTFRKGDNHSSISDFKVKLNRIGLSGILVTDYFGDYTERRVRDFQSYYGLANTGEIDVLTTLKIEEVYASPFQLDNRHNELPSIKEKLNQLGYGPITVTSYYGSYMKNQVERFQRDHGLIVNGIVDSVTYDTLDYIIDNLLVKLFLDPGHGGRDPGGSGYNLIEKDIVLDIALKTANILRNQYRYIDVKLSRESDRFVELEDRAKAANSWGADYYLSLHTNSFNGVTSGFESFIYSKSNNQETMSRQITIHDYLVNKMQVVDRGKKRADFNVLRNASMPALLIEYMFIDYRPENQLLKSSDYRATLARLTAEAIALSFNLQPK